MTSAGYSRPPIATIVTPLPPVIVVKKAFATMQTMARPPGIHPRALDAAQGTRSGWFHTVNRYLARKLVTRFGAREGAAALGHLLPFGVGAAFGGATNWFMARGIAKDAMRLFRQLPAG